MIWEEGDEVRSGGKEVKDAHLDQGLLGEVVVLFEVCEGVMDRVGLGDVAVGVPPEGLPGLPPHPDGQGVAEGSTGQVDLQHRD